MGLLKIFTRKPGIAKDQSHDIHSGRGTPFRGTQPSPELQAEASGTLTSQHHEPNQSQTSLASSNNFKVEAYASFVPRHRGHTVDDRPGTASSNHSVTRDWFQSPVRPRREPRRPPVAFRKHSSSASLSMAYKVSAPVEDKACELASLKGMRGRNGSKSSVGSIRFKDLLDAQDEIRPTDFRSRVKATGAKDYGEDVADRNIYRNRASDIHATTPSSLPTNKRSKSLNSTNYLSHLRPAYIKGQILGSRETSSLKEVGTGSSVSKRNKQRLSLHTYIPSGMASPLTPTSTNTSPGLPAGISSKDFAIPGGRPMSPDRKYNPSPTASNFSGPPSSRGPQRTILEWRDFLSRYGYDDDIDDKLYAARAHENISESDLSSHHKISSLNASHISLSKNPRRESHQSFMSSIASSIASRPQSVEITPLTWPRPRNEDTPMDPRTLSDDFNGADGRPTSRFSQNHSLPNSSEDQWGYHRAKSLGTLTSPLEVDEQISARPSKICGWSASEISKSESTVSSNVFSASSGRPYSRHTTCTSLDSTSHALSTRKSEESLSASNGQRGASSGWSPATTRSTVFNIDDYVSSDDDSFTTARKGTQITAEGEEDLLFKPGYGITGVALPGLEEIEEDAVYPAISCRSNRSNSVSSDGSVAIAASPIDNRFSMARDIPMPLRHVRSDPEVEFYGTFGRCSMRDHFKESETSTSAGDERNMPSAVDFEDYFRPPPTRTGTESGLLDEMYALSRGLTRLSALGSPNDRNVGGSDGGPARSVAETVKEEKAKVDIATAIRLRKEEKARRRAEGLRNSREKRSTMTFDEMGEDEAIAKLKELPGDGNEDGDLGRRRHTDGKGKDVTVE